MGDYLTRLRTVLEERGMKLPKAYSPRPSSTTTGAATQWPPPFASQ